MSGLTYGLFIRQTGDPTQQRRQTAGIARSPPRPPPPRVFAAITTSMADPSGVSTSCPLTPSPILSFFLLRCHLHSSNPFSLWAPGPAAVSAKHLPSVGRAAAASTRGGFCHRGGTVSAPDATSRTSGAAHPGVIISRPSSAAPPLPKRRAPAVGLARASFVLWACGEWHTTLWQGGGRGAEDRGGGSGGPARHAAGRLTAPQMAGRHPDRIQPRAPRDPPCAPARASTTTPRCVAGCRAYVARGGASRSAARWRRVWRPSGACARCRQREALAQAP